MDGLGYLFALIVLVIGAVVLAYTAVALMWARFGTTSLSTILTAVLAHPAERAGAGEPRAR